MKDRQDLNDLEKEYASMVLRLDQTVGLILDTLDDHGLSENTLVIFASDNGHTIEYNSPGRNQNDLTKEGIPVNQKDSPFRTKTCGDVFNGNDGMAGLKFSNWDGGNRIVFLAKWPEVIKANTTTNHLISNYDTLATIAEVVGYKGKVETDGLSYLPVLKGEPEAEEHDYVGFSSRMGPALVTKEGWKLRTYMPNDAIQ